MFSKTFNSQKHGQIVVMRAASEYLEPEIRVHFKPKHLGICTITSQYESSEEADVEFEKVDQQRAEKVVAEAVFPASDFLGGEG